MPTCMACTHHQQVCCQPRPNSLTSFLRAPAPTQVAAGNGPGHAVRPSCQGCYLHQTTHATTLTAPIVTSQAPSHAPRQLPLSPCTNPPAWPLLSMSSFNSNLCTSSAHALHVCQCTSTATSSPNLDTRVTCQHATACHDSRPMLQSMQPT